MAIYRDNCVTVIADLQTVYTYVVPLMVIIYKYQMV